MSNLQKFNSTIEDLEKEVFNLQKVTEAYQKFQQLTETYNLIGTQFEENNKTLNKINELQKAEQGFIVKSISDFENINKLYKLELSKLFEEKTDLIRKENKDFYKELESTIKIKLDDNKSQIKQLIENERNQIKQIFEIEFAKNTKEIKHEIENGFEKQTEIILKSQKIIMIVSWMLSGITIILSGFALIKLFN